MKAKCLPMDEDKLPGRKLSSTFSLRLSYNATSKAADEYLFSYIVAITFVEVELGRVWTQPGPENELAIPETTRA